VIAGAVMIALNLKSLSLLKLKSKSHSKKISLPNLTKPLALAPLHQCLCLCLKTSIILNLVISPKAIGKALGQVNLVHHSEKSQSELSLIN
jgi:hypothetical protein